MNKAESLLSSDEEYSQCRQAKERYCQWIKRKDVAKLLGVSPTTLDHLMSIGKLNFKRCLIGKKLKGYCHIEVNAILQKWKILKNSGRYLVVSKTFEPYTLF
jgi:hypothetical protein